MAQYVWTYYTPLGRPYNVYIYHGEESGHVIVYINAGIIIIDFNQLESKKYHFALEHQLMELEMIKNEEGFEYVLTPIVHPYFKQAMEREKKYDLMRVGLFFLVMIFFSLLVIYGIKT